MSRRRRRHRPPEGEFDACIESLAHDGRGVARIDGKATFLWGGLPGEKVRFRYLERRRHHDVGTVVGVEAPAEDRVEPRCTAFGVCGGCSLQHQAPEAQVAAKQQVLLDNLAQLGGVQPDTVLPPITGTSPWGYRRKARLGVRDVPRKGGVLVGFRERGSSFVAETGVCEILHPHVGRLIGALGRLVESLSVRQRLPQIEIAMDDCQCVLILRLLEPLTDADRDALAAFATRHAVVFYTQTGGPDTVAPLGEPVELAYALPDFDLSLRFEPTDFTQVNTEVNRAMVARAIELLALDGSERVLDLFCGIGNFTLPIGRRAAGVVGVEGDAVLVERARANARRNGLDNTAFFTADLYGELPAEPWLGQRFNKALLDPPRSGAWQVLPLLPRLGVERVVYVSCYPGTLARDAGELVRAHGYRLRSAGVMDMFPHTAHVESIALFEKEH
jgi:23S rRNA (uracil1939-C5)-methyltransferase